ncbi:MAG TPA: zf-HC2 domain-containing protein, partial [Ktedonobacterales bacterium]|nr:zf-HC2 domain-containing protein [Ktedonobacterales bacterium]
MKCEMAEVNLSAYLDGMLEPQLREDVASHLATCAACSEILADYRRYNQLITDLPRISPSESLRARIFESPEYLELLRDLERKDARAAGRSHGASPGWARVALLVAAVVALVVGPALLIKQGFFSRGASSVAVGTQTYGNPPPSGVPLAAGLRLVYAHDGAIRSAPEHGVGAAQRLTSTGVSVGAWSVAPDGKHIAYVDLRTHTLHVVRSDGQSDHSIATLPADGASSALTMMAWAPNSQLVAYVTRIAGGTALHVVNMNGSNGQQVIHQGGDISLLTWSQNSQRLAYVLHGAASAIQTYDLASGRDQQVAAQADPNAIAANVSMLAWLADTQNPTLTWATTSTTSGVDSLFSMALGSASAQRLTQAGTRFASAAFSAARGGGAWL